MLGSPCFKASIRSPPTIRPLGVSCTGKAASIYGSWAKAEEIMANVRGMSASVQTSSLNAILDCGEQVR